MPPWRRCPRLLPRPPWHQYRREAARQDPRVMRPGSAGHRAQPQPRSAASSMKEHLKPGWRRGSESPLLQHFLHEPCQAPPIAYASRALKAEEERVICNILPYLLPFACCCRCPLRPMQLCKHQWTLLQMMQSICSMEWTQGGAIVLKIIKECLKQLTMISSTSWSWMWCYRSRIALLQQLLPHAAPFASSGLAFVSSQPMNRFGCNVL
ncbi:unnamed protein product [Miscanthus lutarioriparius]|uniref:Uncharacterized protein n=1 Tax=Miscanthus lutarioriparius TaxID=422564 RepID=A0A811S6E5_9POAL|nr:unnamed protein product [Miscanthus lutarioriparius]